jgi:hypothetical protein
MRERDALIGAGLVAFCVGVLAMVPAQVALLAADARASGVSGTIWRGTAEALQLDAFRLGRTEWSLHPMALMAARLGADIATQWNGGRGEGYVTIGLGGAVACEDCEVLADMASLRGLIPVPLPTGNMALTIQTLDIKDGWPRRAVGAARVEDMPLTLPGQSGGTSATGSYEALFNADPVAEGGRLEAVVTDLGGPVQVAARLQLTPPGTYLLAGSVQARPDAPPALTNGLALLGPQRSDGSHEFAFSGTF